MLAKSFFSATHLPYPIPIMSDYITCTIPPRHATSHIRSFSKWNPGSLAKIPECRSDPYLWIIEFTRTCRSDSYFCISVFLNGEIRITLKIRHFAWLTGFQDLISKNLYCFPLHIIPYHVLLPVWQYSTLHSFFIDMIKTY